MYLLRRSISYCKLIIILSDSVISHFDDHYSSDYEVIIMLWS